MQSIQYTILYYIKSIANAVLAIVPADITNIDLNTATIKDKITLLYADFTTMVSSYISPLKTASDNIYSVVNGFVAPLNDMMFALQSIDGSTSNTAVAVSNTNLMYINSDLIKSYTKYASIPTHDLVNLKTATITSTNNKTYQSYVSIGSTTNVYTTESAIAPQMSPGQFLNRPTTATTYSIASTNAADSGGGLAAKVLVVSGWVSSTNNMGGTWVLEFESVVLNGVTPVTTTKTYIRLYATFVVACGTTSTNSPVGGCNVGVISLIPTGSTTFTVGGLPVDPNKRVGVIDINEGINFNGQLAIPPNHSFYFTNVSMMNGATGAQQTIVKIYGQTYTAALMTTGYRELSRFIATDTSPSVQSRNEALPDVCLPGNGLFGTDIVASCFRIGGNNSTNLEVILNGVFVKNS